jgi:hypothetical protein
METLKTVDVKWESIGDYKEGLTNVNSPAVWANEKQIFAHSDVRAEFGTCVIQGGAGRPAVK